MPSILIACPHADWYVPTGEIANSRAEINQRNTLRRCPECGRGHEWTPDDALIADHAPILTTRSGIRR